jgi:hypothetical protein
MTVLREENIKKARKDYTCDACNAMFDYGSINQVIADCKLTVDEIKSITEAGENNFKIKKGNPYYKQINTEDGFCVFRAIPEIHKICIKYDLYDFD